MNTFKLKLTMLSAIIFLTVQAAMAQHIFKGRVIDNVTHEPVEAVSVYAGVKSTATNASGNFQIDVTTDTATLIIYHIGYQKKSVRINIRERVVIGLDRGAISLNEVKITPHLSANPFYTLSALDLSIRPVNSSQDLMRLVPGLFIAQHMGGGKAEQIFVRGFDADHGTDFNVSVDGMPVNMVSHIHGQGYADLHFMIPEIVSTCDFGKGPYYTDKGDFTTAGYLNYTTKDAVDRSMISLEGGQFHSYRVAGVIDLLSAKAKQNGENAYIAGEYNYTNGPFQLAEHYKRFNLFGKYTKQLGQNNKLSLSASTFSTSWIPSGEIPERAVAAGTTAIDDNGNAVKLPAAANIINRFGTIDSMQNGKSTRVNAIAKLSSDLKNNWSLENQLYYTHYTFKLHVNTTFFADDNENGDERYQNETRDMFGYNGKISKRSYLGNSTLISTAGIGDRMDRTYGNIYTGVTQTYQPLEVISEGDVKENNANAYLDETLETGKWLLNAGARIDYLHFNFHDSTQNKAVISPKINVQYTANEQIQFYLKAGKGFHSNDARAVIGNNGLQILPAAYGADLGLNWKPVPRLYLNAAVWYLYLQQEFVYTDDGTIEPGGKTRREGVDFSARYQLAKWLFADLNINLAKPRLVGEANGENYLPLAPTFTSTGGLDFKFKNGINGGISYRYMHKRPGNENYTLTADGYYVTDLKVNYTQKRYELGLSIENLFNTKWNEFEAEEVTQLRNESAPVDQMSFTPGTPFYAKLRVALFF
ncbi:TonB-dependent receptor [Mucilaginibacter sp. BJC16-A38]|uniref:TonB-dependent receptor n=1 Tax=Mucilaginibacter phenanthrenivorans TaxID=1234842 RepID=UPI002157D5B7|nr:TonB-dependent receptor [Mucilaginibacter phenanthrenivorans]MCR8558967.1 TonB-dependent receptor [Mucilaginibacter phenanthrenivorans]